VLLQLAPHGQLRVLQMHAGQIIGRRNAGRLNIFYIVL
jgi:hypothetical protein